MKVLPREPRVAASLPVSLFGRPAALSADLSRGGFCLETRVPLPVGAPVRGTVTHGPLKLAFTGRIAWSQLGDPQASTWHRMGIAFDELSPGLRALLGLTLGR